MKFKFAASPESVPVGRYRARFERIDQTQMPKYGDPDTFEDTLRFVWTIESGECAGSEVSRLVRPVFTENSNLARLYSEMTGLVAKDGVTVDFGEFIGQRGVITVGHSQSGRAKVASWSPDLD